MPLFLQSGEVFDFVGHLAVANQTVGGLDEAVLVDPGIGRKRCDQTDVRALRSLDRTDPAIVGRVHIADFEAGALPGQTPGSQGREAALVGNLGQGVGLVHELGELGGAEELLDHRRHRLGVDQVVGHEAVDFLQAHALLDGALHAHQADPVLVLQQLADGPYPAVAEVVDIVDGALAVAQVDEVAHHLKDILLGQGGVLKGGGDPQLVIHLDPAHHRKVIALGIEEQAFEQRLGAADGGRIARAQTAVDLHHRLVGGVDLVLQQGLAQIRPDIEVVDKQHAQIGDATLAQIQQGGRGDFLIAFHHNLTGGGIDDVGGGDLADHILFQHRNELDPFFRQLADGGLGEFPVALEHHFPVGGNHIDAGALTGKQGQVDLLLVAVFGQNDLLQIVVVIEQFLGRITEGFEQHRGRQFATAVDAHKEDVFMIKIEVQPGPPIGDDPGAVKNLTAGVGLALVVVKEDTGRAVQLADDDSFSPVNDEGSVFGHERDLAEIDLLLLDITNRLNPGLLVYIPGNQAHPDFDRGSKGHSALMTLVDVVFGCAKGVCNIFERTGLAEVANRKDRAKHGLEADVLSCRRGKLRLEETLVGILLDINEVGYVDDPLDLGKMFPQKLVIRDRISHGFSLR